MQDDVDKSAGVKVNRPERSRLSPWYDSNWLTAFSTAKAIIREARPEALTTFVEALCIFRTRPEFEVRFFDRIFDEATLAEIGRATALLRPTDLELHEARMFGRFVVHNHPFFTELHQRTLPLVSEAVGEPVEMSYNFLSLHGKLGVCPPHMDSPKAKWTLDLCINQSAPWPIYFSQVCPRPEAGAELWSDDNWEEQVKRSTSLDFTPYTLQPGQAVVFSGSSQWHYREAFPGAGPGQHCDLLFFHFIPRGASELVRPQNWARLFGIPELDRASITAD